MEILGFMVLFLIILAATASTSSDRDGRGRHYRYDDDWGDEPYQGYYPPYPPYPPPGWRPRRRNRFGEWVLAFFMGVLAVSAVVGGLAYAISSKDPIPPVATDSPSSSDVPIFADEPGVNDAPTDDKKGGQEIDPQDDEDAYQPTTEDEEVIETPQPRSLDNNVRIIRLAVTNESNFQQLKKENADLPIEGFWDNGRVHALIIARSQLERQQWGHIIESRHGTSAKFNLQNVDWPAKNICGGGIVKYPSASYWVCEE